MLKLTKKADYGLIALKHLAENGSESLSAKDIAEAYDIPPEAMAKILQRLVKSGFLRSHHGTNGGYVLARDPKAITAFEVIRAIDGPLFITSCSSEHDNCQQSSKCNVKEPLQKVNQSIREVLNRITVADMQDAQRRKTDIESSEKPMELVTLAHS